jgi:hypothetical protein
MTPQGPVWQHPRKAYGQPAVNNQWGVTIEYDAEGRPIVRAGEGGGTGAVTKTTQTALEKDVVDLGDTLQQYRRMQQAYAPRFQTIGNRWENLKSTIQSKAGYTLAPEAEAELKAFTTHKREAGAAFSEAVKKFAGTAMTAQEAERVLVWNPNAGSGLWDGDSPVEYETKMNKGAEALEMAIARKQYLLRNGIRFDFAKDNNGGISLDQMPELMKKRAVEIASELKGGGVEGDALNQRLRERMRQEFGL